MRFEEKLLLSFKKEIGRFFELMGNILEKAQKDVQNILKSMSYSDEKKYQIIYKDLFKEYSLVQRRVCRVGIAQIGISDAGDFISEYYQIQASGLWRLKKEKVKLVRSKVRRLIEKASKEEINILLFPELAIDLNFSMLLEDIYELAQLYNMYIIPGSYHDQESKQNISIVFGPKGILWEQEKHIPAIIRIKGKHFKERINIDSLPRKLIVCNTEFGRIAVVICRDFLDMDLRVELKNFRPFIDIILNPAFTPLTSDFEAAHFDARRSIYAYCFFANIGEFGNSLISSPEKERVKRILPSRMEDIIYKDIDLFKLRTERKRWQREKVKDNNFIQSTK